MHPAGKSADSSGPAGVSGGPQRRLAAADWGRLCAGPHDHHAGQAPGHQDHQRRPQKRPEAGASRTRVSLYIMYCICRQKQEPVLPSVVHMATNCKPWECSSSVRVVSLESWRTVADQISTSRKPADMQTMRQAPVCNALCPLRRS